MAPKNRSTYRWLGAFVLMAAIVIAGCDAGTGKQDTAESKKPAATASSSPPGARSDKATALQEAYRSAVRTVGRSVVEITTGAGLGSGVVYDTEGHIVTNAHVVGSARNFQVRFSTGGPALPARLVASYPVDDLAVIKVRNAKNIRPAKFDTGRLTIGTIVLAVGNPLGLEGSVTDGIVSATGRTLTEPQSADSPGATLPDAIQTSAAINPGNSGGALVDLDGEVVGIPTLAAVNQENGGAAPGIGFAIPSRIVTDIAGQIVQHGRVVNSHRAALGVRATDAIDPQTNEPGGVGVVQVNSGSPADQAGIKTGDIIIALNGVRTPNSEALGQALAQLEPGDKTKVRLRLPGGSEKTVTVILGQLPGGR